MKLPGFSKVSSFFKGLWPRVKEWGLKAKNLFPWFFEGPKWRVYLLCLVAVFVALALLGMIFPSSPEGPTVPRVSPAPSTPQGTAPAPPPPAPKEHPAQPLPAKPSEPKAGKERVAPGARERAQAPPMEKAAPEVEARAGVDFVTTLIGLLRAELDRTLGWRPNDIIVGKFTDNVNNFQLGVLEAVRYTAIRLKEDLTRHGDADAYDPHLVNAVNLLLNRSDKFWFPSAESQYDEALAELGLHLENLRSGKSRFIPRGDNLMSLMRSYKDLLGNCHRNLVKARELDGSEVTSSMSDDYFYYSQGVAKVFYEIFKVVKVTFREQLMVLDAMPIMDDMISQLSRSVALNPILIMESDLQWILANHRANMAAPLSAVLGDMDNLLKYGG